MYRMGIVISAAEMEPRLFDLDFQLLADAALTMISVFVLFLALSYLLFNPARQFMQARQDRIAGELQDAKSKQEEAQRLKEEYESRFSEIEKEREEILFAARQKALENESRGFSPVGADAFRGGIPAHAADRDGCAAGEDHFHQERLHHVRAGGLCAGR